MEKALQELRTFLLEKWKNHSQDKNHISRDLWRQKLDFINTAYSNLKIAIGVRVLGKFV